MNIAESVFFSLIRICSRKKGGIKRKGEWGGKKEMKKSLKQALGGLQSKGGKPRKHRKKDIEAF